MDIGGALVTKIVDEGRFNEVQRSGITEDFLDDDSAAILNYVKRHFGEYKSVPTRDAVKLSFPGFQFASSGEPLEFLIDVVKEQYRRSLFESSLERVAGVYGRDTKEAEQLLRDTLAQLNVTQKTFRDVDIAKSVTDRLEAYATRKENPGANGILSRWPAMDEQTLGFQPEEFAVLVGEKWMGKSWIMIWLAYQAMKQGERVLFLTKEMSQAQIARRFDAVFAHVCFDRLRKGTLTAIEESLMIERLTKLEESTNHLIIARQGVSTIDDIEAKAVETDATIIFADSVYLFPPNAKSGNQSEVAKRLEISHRCKEIASNLGVPFVVSVQAGRKKSKKPTKPDIDNIEWSNAFSQDAETVFFIQKDDLDREIGRAQIHLLKSRDGDLAEFYIEQDFETMEFNQRNEEMAPTTEVFDEDEEETLFGE